MFKKIVIGVLVAFLVLTILLALTGTIAVTRSFPKTKGEIHLAGLDGPVDIYRDKFGIPQIYATTPHDLFFAQGYVHAQDRFWQMDFWRHIGSGRLAEMFGADQVDTDEILRTFGFARVVEQELAAIDPTNEEILQSYADGVNAYLADHQGSALSLEYAILKLNNAGYKPEPWTPLHTLTWAKVMAYDLGGNMDSEIQRAILLKTLTPEQLAQIIPPYPADKPVIVPELSTSQAPSDNKAGTNQRSYLLVASPAFESLNQKLTALHGVLAPQMPGIGSNNWVISGKLTSTGKPFLANDPHLAAQIPAIWYEVGLHCAPKSDACPFEVTGFSFAGAPGVIIGHNDRIAWGFTNVGPDVQDLYVEKINPNNPNQYEVNGQWQDMQFVNETLQVAGGEPVLITVRYTRHGPILSDTTYLPEDFSQKVGIELPQPYALALRWTALEPGFTFRAILMMNRAQNWEEFRQAASEFVVPSQNFIYADVDGNIGYQTPGNIPIRASGDGTLPVPGWTDDYEWTGYIPFEQLPMVYNPAKGYIATANNAVVGPDYPYLISKEFDYGHRAQRIVEMIENAPGPIDIPYIASIQGDNKDLNAEQLLPVLMKVPLANQDQEKARQMLANWDFQDHMDSPEAALFAAFWKNLLAFTFQDDLPKDAWPEGGSRWFEVVKNLIQEPNSPWWDNKSTTTVETRDDVFTEAFAAAVDELQGALGKNPKKWTWGDLHTLTLVNQTLGKSGISLIENLINRGPYRTSGGTDIVNATGWDAAESEPGTYIVRTLPSMRMIVDLSDLGNSLAIHTTGQSGHAFHPHYIDMTDLWRTIQYHPMLWEQAQVEQGAEAHLRLMP